MKSHDDDVFSILRDYPRVYLACHVRHPRGRKLNGGVTGRDATLLAHAAVGELRPRDLAKHLGLAASTVSEAVKRLISLGLMETGHPQGDRRGKTLRITRAGRSAIEDQSVLDAALVRTALDRLPPAKRTAVVEGLALFANSASSVRNETARSRR